MSGPDLERLRVGLGRAGVFGQTDDEAVLPTNAGPRVEQVELKLTKNLNITFHASVKKFYKIKSE